MNERSGQHTKRQPPDRGELVERAVESASAFAIFTQDPDGIITSWNVGAERLIGYQDAEIVGRASDVIFTSGDNCIGAPAAERALAMLQGRAEDERWHVRKDGSRFWGSGLLIPLSGSDTGFVKILRDLTERHISGKRLRENEELSHQTKARLIDDGEMVGTSTDIHDMRSLRERQEILLAVVCSIAKQTLRASASLEEFDAEFGQRLATLGRVQGLLARTDHQALDLGTLVEAELAAHADGLRETAKVRIEGPQVVVSVGAAQVLTLALHELATNAVKYGALKQPSARFSVRWHTEEADAKRIVLDWRESGVAMPADEPRRKGYGTDLIERALPYQLKAMTRLQFGPDGGHCHRAVPVAAARTEASQMEASHD